MFKENIKERVDGQGKGGADNRRRGPEEVLCGRGRYCHVMVMDEMWGAFFLLGQVARKQTCSICHMIPSH